MHATFYPSPETLLSVAAVLASTGVIRSPWRLGSPVLVLAARPSALAVLSGGDRHRVSLGLMG